MNRYTPPNIEGISKLEILESSKVVEILPSDVITGAPVIVKLQYGATFEEIPFVKGTGSYMEGHPKDESGDHHPQTIQVSVAKNRRELDNWLNSKQHLSYVAKVTDRNGNIRIVGTPTAGLELSVPLSNPAQGRNEYQFTFFADAGQRAPYLLSAESIVNAGNNFSDEFSKEFAL